MNNTPKKGRKVAIIEPSAIITAGLKRVLDESGAELELCGTFDESLPFAERAAPLKTDLGLMDTVVFDLQKRHALHSYFENLPDATLVAIIYGFIEPETLKQYHGSIHIYDDSRKIIRQLRQAMDDRTRDTEPTGESYELTDRESEILVSVAKGMTNKEIADAHHISVHTVISHRKNITRKTGIKTVSGLTVYALLNNLIDQSEIE